MTPPPARALTIAGTDPSGGTGIQADLKTFHALGTYGMSVIAALTAQNTHGVVAIQDIPPDFVRAQLDAVLRDIGTDAVKTGMLANAETIAEVASGLRHHEVRQLVVDPVCASKHGDPLLREDALDSLRNDLIPLARVVTPNLTEVKLLTGVQVDKTGDLERAAEGMLELGAEWALIKGGPLPDNPRAVDLLSNGVEIIEIDAERLDNPHTNGTGCTLAAAIAAYLARGLDPVEAVRTARAFVTQAIRFGLVLGSGNGPVDHLWRNSSLAVRAGVAAILRDGHGRILLTRRTPAGWAPLSGRIQPGETVVHALHREVRQETGLELTARRLVGLYSDPSFQIVGYPTGENVHFVTAVFDGTVSTGDADGVAAERWAWFAPDELPSDLLEYARRWLTDAEKPAHATVVR